MSQQPNTETDRLANVIQVLQLGQKTGRLMVERALGARFEQGLITFVSGQVVQASVNQTQGPEAFEQLKTWGACRFAFVPEGRPGATRQMPALPPSPPLQLSPSPGQGVMNPRPAGTSPLRQRSSGNTAPLPGARTSMYSRTTRNLGGGRQPAPTPTAWLAVPYRTRHMEEGIRLIEQMGLSRTHRRLFLLVDGNRTVKELIRLMSHDPDGVLKLLQDLEHAGVIQL
ncbi:MAG TPA: DUF4388 domain-containing protein [Ktedonobacteraceae bacterium]|nr:DUF4388 domain-containing protein [Ktedonobacteraceae bacterium]